MIKLPRRGCMECSLQHSFIRSLMQMSAEFHSRCSCYFILGFWFVALSVSLVCIYVGTYIVFGVVTKN
jgi:hypothetical protein